MAAFAGAAGAPQRQGLVAAAAAAIIDLPATGGLSSVALASPQGLGRKISQFVEILREHATSGKRAFLLLRYGRGYLALAPEGVLAGGGRTMIVARRACQFPSAIVPS